jgi:RNA polymerase sigma factor (sigma-70 family)
MATANVSAFLRRLTRGMVAETLADQSDRQLVEQFLAGRGEAVFEAILRRHGAMVYRVCWRVLQHHQDAEDAFQATFLVLAQRLRSVRKHASLASWLHGVAQRLALRAKAGVATRRRHEAQASVCRTMPPDDVSWGEVRVVLDAELAALPEKWRLPLVLCFLEGRTQDEAAAQLGWSPRTLRRRLEEARTGLGRRLSRRGVAWSAALSAVLLSESAAWALLSPGLVDSTVKAVSVIAAGQAAAAGLISAKAAALTEGVLQTMLLSKIKVATALLLVVAAVGVGGNRLLVPTRAGDGVEEPKQVQTGKPKPPPATNKPRILIEARDDGSKRQVLIVRDPSSGKFMALSREQGIVEVEDYLEFHVKKVREAKDEKSIREALKSLEKSIQNMTDALSLPVLPAEKAVDFNKAGTERPRVEIGVRLPLTTDTLEQLDKIVDRLGLAGQLAKINAVNVRHLREDAIRIVKDYIQSTAKKLNDAKDEKSMRQALQTLAEWTQLLKELLAFSPPAEGKLKVLLPFSAAPVEKKPDVKKPERDKAPVNPRAALDQATWKFPASTTPARWSATRPFPERVALATRRRR